MSDRNFNNSRIVKNPLLSAAGFDFSTENFSTGAVLFPASEDVSLLSTSDGGEVDSFLGQNPPPSAQNQNFNSTSEAKPVTSLNPGILPLTPLQGYTSQSFINNPVHSTTTSPFPKSFSVFSVAPSISPVLPVKPDHEQVIFSQGTQSVFPPPIATGFASQPSDISQTSSSVETYLSFNPGASSHDEPPALTLPPVARVPPFTGAKNSYRLGNVKRPLYVQPPGLSTGVSIPADHSSNLYTTPGNVMETRATSVQHQPAVLQPEAMPYTEMENTSTVYRPVYHHWFYKKVVETRNVWHPFSMTDSLALEEAFVSTETQPETLVSTDGGRYDVNVLRRQRLAVFWQEPPTEVRRCSWFYKGSTDTSYVPYEENVSSRLEEEYKISYTTNDWNRQIEFPNGETIVLHGPTVMAHFLPSTSPDAWGNVPPSIQTQSRPHIVKRGMDEFDIEEGEQNKADHLLFMVHGIGSFCDLKFRTIVEVVDLFRSLSLQLMQSHFCKALNERQINRIEILPISWHSILHGEETGIDRKLKNVTLKSIPKLRDFTNDTLLDILIYTSPVYCQTIIDTVAKEINRLYTLFKKRNPTFEGGVSLSGHSLGSLILFDLLNHQKIPKEPATQESNQDSSDGKTGNGEHLSTPEHNSSQQINYVVGNAGTGQPFITYPQLIFQPKAFFALGSPIGMFVTVRGIDKLGESFKFPTCPSFFNIFHPFDPVAYRIESLVNPELTDCRPLLIPHHKGRKRMHLEFKETMTRVGTDMKQKIVESIRRTWNTINQFAMFHRPDDQSLQQEVDKMLEDQLQEQRQMENTQTGTDESSENVSVGQLNGGHRIDYVLQEAPLESINEYVSAIGSHLCYWESEDTMLMILKEIYSKMGISADSSSDKHDTNSGSERNIVGENISNSVYSSASTPIATLSPNVNFPPIIPGPTHSRVPEESVTPAESQMEKPLEPPPLTGFVRKTNT